MIPIKLRRELALRNDMKACCWCGDSPVEFNHSLFYRGRQINELYSIKPLCLKCHRQTDGSIDHAAKEYCEYLSIKEGLEHLKAKYPRFNWAQRLRYLQLKYNTL